MTPAHKIAKAKRLLREATCELRQKQKMDRAADLCKCGHRRDMHSVSHDINYTHGFCMHKGRNGLSYCKCEWFNG